MTKLSINVNKVATLRNSRGGNVPDVIKIARDCEIFGADGISVHPWPDERHIRLRDVYELRQTLTKDFNIEGYPTPEFVGLIVNVKPQQVTLVPDSPTQLTSNTGWDTETHFDVLSEVIDEIRQSNIRTVVFVSPEKKMIEFAAKAGADRVELYAGGYAEKFTVDKQKAVAPYIEAADYAHRLGMGVNAGHDFNMDNLEFFAHNVPWIDEISIGHALISDSLYLGLEETVKKYKQLLA